MPCNDISEYLKLTLDGSDCIESFSLQKNTCGAPVGNVLLINHVAGSSAEEVMSKSTADLVPEFYQVKRLDQFLLTKQHVALREALAVYVGMNPGGTDQVFAVEKIEHGAEQTVISGLLKVHVLAEKVEACGNCGCAAKGPDASPRNTAA
ncbi:MAG: hypothetical protein V3T05_07580 [Myxococcota bacterium]